MMAWVHASIGAALGSQASTHRSAFGAGVASHFIADLLPHRDFELPVEAPLALTALALIGWRFGMKSREFTGALGGIAPDIENGLERLGVLPATVFPTHTKYKWFIGHGKKIESPLPQILIALSCVALLEYSRRAK
jgi:hypothetical protein